jgi:hypothetical protein
MGYVVGLVCDGSRRGREEKNQLWMEEKELRSVRATFLIQLCEVCLRGTYVLAIPTYPHPMLTRQHPPSRDVSQWRQTRGTPHPRLALPPRSFLLPRARRPEVGVDRRGGSRQSVHSEIPISLLKSHLCPLFDSHTSTCTSKTTSPTFRPAADRILRLTLQEQELPRRSPQPHDQ